jgi:hypothetical protein
MLSVFADPRGMAAAWLLGTLATVGIFSRSLIGSVAAHRSELEVCRLGSLPVKAKSSGMSPWGRFFNCNETVHHQFKKRLISITS